MPKFMAKIAGHDVEIDAIDEVEAVEICRRVELNMTRKVIAADVEKYSLVKNSEER